MARCNFSKGCSGIQYDVDLTHGRVDQVSLGNKSRDWMFKGNGMTLLTVSRQDFALS